MTYNEIMQKAGKRINPKIYYYDSDNNLVEYEYDDILEVKLSFNASLTGTIMKCLTCNLYVELPSDTAIYFSNTATYGSYSQTKVFGPYYVYTSEYNADDETYDITLYDAFLNSMVDYEALDVTYPCTIMNFLNALCDRLGYTSNLSAIPNSSRIISSDIYDGIGYTYRDVFDDIGEATATLFEIDGLKVKICSLGTDEITIDDDILKNENITFGEHFGPINSIVLSRSADSDNVYMRDETLTEWNEYKITDNQLMNNNDRSDYLEELYNALYGIEYDIYDLELVGYGGFDVLDKLVISTGDNTYYSYVFNNEQTFTQGYAECIYAEMPEENVTDYSTSDTTDKKINQAYLIVDKANQTITGLVSSVDEITEQYSSLEVTVDNITQTVSTLSDQSSAIASITVTLEEIQQEITALSDLTTSDMSMGSITLKDVNESALIYLQIYPTGTDISYLYPSNSLYPSNDLYPLSRDVVIKSDEEEIRYTLPCNLLYYSSDVYDEFIYSYETSTCYKIKRVDIDENGDKYPLDEEEVIYYDFELINLSGGDYSIYLLSFSDGMLQARAMVSNLYTDQYVTQAQYTSGLSVLKEEITASVEEELTLIDGNIETLSSELNLQSDEISLKLNSSDFTSSAVINLINNRDGTSTALISADNINLTASNVISLLAGNTLNLTSNNIAISATNFSVTSDGNITATGADISGKITATSGSFTGSIYASSGTIGGMTLTSNSIYSGTSSMSSTTAGIYLGTAGFRQYSSSSAYVNIANGILTCAGATITGTISGSTISGSAISGGSITIGSYFSVTSAGLTQMSTSGKGFLSLQTTTHPYASALSLVNGENYGIYFVSGTSQSSVGSNLSHIYDSGSGSLFIRSLTSSGTVNINHTSSGAVGGAVGISNIVIDSNTITGSGGASMFANNNCAFVPVSGYYAYVGATSSSNRIAVSSSGPSSLNVKKNLVNIEDEYEDLYKDLQKINMYNFDYKYKGIKDFDSDFGFIIDELEDTEHISKYIRNFECKGRIENDTLISKANDDVPDEDLPFSYKEWERDAYIKLLFILIKSIQNKLDRLESEVENG